MESGGGVCRWSVGGVCGWSVWVECVVGVCGWSVDCVDGVEWSVKCEDRSFGV